MMCLSRAVVKGMLQKLQQSNISLMVDMLPDTSRKAWTTYIKVK